MFFRCHCTGPESSWNLALLAHIYAKVAICKSCERPSRRHSRNRLSPGNPRFRPSIAPALGRGMVTVCGWSPAEISSSPRGLPAGVSVSRAATKYPLQDGCLKPFQPLIPPPFPPPNQHQYITASRLQPGTSFPNEPESLQHEVSGGIAVCTESTLGLPVRLSSAGRLRKHTPRQGITAAASSLQLSQFTECTSSKWVTHGTDEQALPRHGWVALSRGAG